MTSTHRGFFLIADISGYSRYLSDSELEHAQDVLRTLMELLIDHTRPPLVISRLAGDAVISYTNDKSGLGGQAFVEMIEGTYVAFRRAIELMVLNTTCQCNACANINGLDLKFFVHHGSYALQNLGDHEELIGEDVNTAFRVMKNSVVETTGMKAYTMFTASAIAALDLPGFAESLVPHAESLESAGPLEAFIQDMHPVYEDRRDTDRIEISAEDLMISESAVIDVPIEVMWDFIGRPEHRAILMNAKRQTIHERSNGRIGAGTVYECVHNNDATTSQTVIGWHPFEQITTRETAPVKGLGSLVTINLRPVENRSEVTVRFSRFRGPRVRAALASRFLGPRIARTVALGLQNLVTEIEAERPPLEVGTGPLMTPESIREAVAKSLKA